MGDHMKPQGAHPYGATTHPAHGGHLLNNYSNQQFYYPNPPSATPQQPHQSYPPLYGAVPLYDSQSSSNDFQSPHSMMMAQQSVNKLQSVQPLPDHMFQTPNSSYSSNVRFSGHHPLIQPSSNSQGQTMHPTVQSQQQFVGSRPPTPSNFNPGFQQNQTQYLTQMSNHRQPAVPFSYPSRPDSGLRREQVPQVNQGQPPVGHQQPNNLPSPLTSNNGFNAVQRFPTQNAVQNASLQPSSQRIISNPVKDENVLEHYSKGHPGSTNSFAVPPPSLKPANGPQTVAHESHKALPTPANNRQKIEGSCPMLNNPLLRTMPDSDKISSHARPMDPSGRANVSSLPGERDLCFTNERTNESMEKSQMTHL